METFSTGSIYILKKMVTFQKDIISKYDHFFD
jgi:hypothetical protein